MVFDLNYTELQTNPLSADLICIIALVNIRIMVFQFLKAFFFRSKKGTVIHQNIFRIGIVLKNKFSSSGCARRQAVSSFF